MVIKDELFDDVEDSCLTRDECIAELLKDTRGECLYCRLAEEDEE